MDTVTRVQILDEVVCVSLHVNALRKGMNKSVLYPTLGKYQMVGWFGGFYGISAFVGYFMPNTFLQKQSVLFQTIQFSMSTQFNCQKTFYFKLFSFVKQF